MDEFKRARQKAMGDGFNRLYGSPSMGAQVEVPVCSVCLDGTQDLSGSVCAPAPDGALFTHVSLVAGPTCKGCRKPLVRKDDVTWMCESPECAELGVGVSAHLFGVFPLRML